MSWFSGLFENLRRSRRFSLVAAVIIALSALAIQHWIEPLSAETPYQLLLGAVAASALFGGVADGVLTLSVIAAGRLYFFTAPRLVFAAQNPSTTFRLVLFVALGGLTAWLVGRLRRTQGQLTAALSSIGDAVAMTDERGKAVFLNPVAENLCGYSMMEARGLHLDDVLNFADQETRMLVGSLGAVGTGVLKSAASPQPVLLRAKNGPDRLVEYSASAIRDSTGRPHGSIVVFRDITGRMELENQLRHAQKMEALGRLAGGVAHDINNILTVINGHADFLRAAPACFADPDLRSSLDTILKGCGDAAQLTHQLLVFSRREPVSRKTAVELNIVIAKLERVLRGVLGDAIELVLEPGTGEALVRADPARIEQIILNLAANARDAMPQGGRFTLRTYILELGPEPAAGSHSLKPGPYVALEVTDTGTGMDAPTRARIFEPFFTTKQAGKGTGLGLSIVYGIVEQCGGQIRVDSRPGSGTSFTALFPQCDEAECPEITREPPIAGRGSGTILLAEDNDGLRNLIASMLASHGFSVLMGRDGAEALDIGAREIGRIDLVVTDIRMPGLGGLELMEGLRMMRKNLKVLYISGGLGPFGKQLERLGPHAGFLSKPFGVAALLDEVSRLMATQPEEALHSSTRPA